MPPRPLRIRSNEVRRGNAAKVGETPIIRVKTREIDYDNRASESDTAIDLLNGKSRQTRLRCAESRRGFAIPSSRIKAAFQQAAYECSAR